jgi:DNA end-binding protein Ku
MHAREYLVALRANDDVLELHTLHWADEVRDPERELPRLPGRQQPGSKELDSARQLIDAMAVDWRPEDYEDTYEKKVRRLVDAKRDGKEVVAEQEPPEGTNVVDLEDALRRSVDRAGSEKASRKSSQKDSRRAGRSRQRSDSGGDSGRGLSELSKRDLYERASDQDIQGRTRMNRRQLIQALSDKRSGKAS